MTELPFTQRTSTIFQRAIEVHRDEWVTERQEIYDTERTSMLQERVHIVQHKGWYLYIRYDIDIDDDDEYDWESLQVMLMVDRHETRTSIYGWSSLENYTPEKFDALVKTYRICQDCQEYCWKEGNFCKTCYPFIMEHTEDCCVCLEKTMGVWCQLPCRHILHRRCFEKVAVEHQSGPHGVIHGRKCPMCRNLCPHGTPEKI